jgi:SprA-related family
MQLQTNIRIDATTLVAGPAAIRAREQREPRPIESGAAAGDPRSRAASEQAAIVNFGAGALDRAQRRQGPSAAEPETDEPQGAEQLPDDQQQAVADLQRRDREVRSHEQTHRSVGGQYTGSIHLDYQVGPDGERYAVSGSTPIDVSPVADDPEATLRKMQIVQRAASAPINPSGADRQVASEAARQTQQARAELAASRYGSARELAPEQAGGASRSPTSGQEQAEPAPPAPFAGRPGEPDAAIPGRLLAIRA